MNQDFGRTLSLLRKEKGVSQRLAAEELEVSQALLSHYENGIREPGLAFVTRACDYYHVSADYLLGRTLDRDGIMGQSSQPVRGGRTPNRQQAADVRKPLVSSTVLLFDLLGRMEDANLLQAAARYLSTAICLLFRHLCQADPAGPADLFPAANTGFESGLGDAEVQLDRCQYTMALQAHIRDRKILPPLSGEALNREYPWAYPALLELMQDTNRRMAAHLPDRTPGQRRRG